MPAGGGGLGSADWIHGRGALRTFSAMRVFVSVLCRGGSGGAGGGALEGVAVLGFWFFNAM